MVRWRRRVFNGCMPVGRAEQALDDSIEEVPTLIRVNSAAKLAAPDAVIAQIPEVVFGGVVFHLKFDAAVIDQVKLSS